VTMLTDTKRRRGRPRDDGRAPLAREDVLRTAAKVIARSTASDVSVKEIADELGCHTASIFNHFPTKQDLVLAVAEEIFAKQLRWVDEIQVRGSAPDIVLFRLIHDDVIYAASGAPSIREVFRAPDLEQEKFRRVAQLMEQYEQRFTTVLSRGIESRVFRDFGLNEMVDCVLALGMTAAYKWQAPSRQARVRLALGAARLALSGLLSDPTRLPSIEAVALALKVARPKP
jgi:AcrR family transcriptional regulator